MEQLIEFFTKFFSIADFPARWHCGKWSEFHGWLYIVSEILIWSAYMAIPILILYFTKKKKVPFNSLFLLFAAFILACGFTHLLDAVIFWVPVYRISALARFITGIVSWATVFAIFRILPIAFSMRTHVEYDTELQEKVKAQQELSKTNLLLRQAQHIAKIGYWEWSPQTRLLNGSDDLFIFHNLPIKEDTYRIEDFFEKVHPDDKALFLLNPNNALQTERIEPTHYRIYTAEGALTHILAHGEKSTNAAGETVYIGTVQDITALKKMEEKLLYRTKELENRVNDLQRFAYVASHDLKEPLRKISIFSSKLQVQYADLLPEKGKSYLDKINSNSTRQLRLIDEVLQFSNLSNPTLNSFEACSLEQVLQEALEDMSLQIEEANALITFEALPTVEIIPAQIQLVFRNILSNAIKFKHPDRQPIIKISVSIRSLQEIINPEDSGKNIATLQSNQFHFNEQFCLLRIEDNGVGFEERYKDDIFDIFKRLHGKEIAGTGIGLATCKRVIENHHGEIFVESSLGKGSIFSILLPLSQKGFSENKTA